MNSAPPYEAIPKEKEHHKKSSELFLKKADVLFTNSSEHLGPRKPEASVQKLKAIASTDDSTIL